MSQLQSDPSLPLYSQIRDRLRRQIAAGTYQPLQRLPSESELMRLCGVSRITVRQALGELEHEQLIFRVPGKGSFVARPKPFQRLTRLQGLAEAMSPFGHHTSNRVLSLLELPASAEVARQLGLSVGQPVCEIRRVRYLDQQPLSLDVTYVPLALGRQLAQADLQQRDIFLILEQDCGVALGHADLAIDSVAADVALAAWLGLSPGSPVLRIERLTFDTNLQAIDFEYLYCRTDNFQFRLTVTRNTQPESATNE